MDDFEDAVQGAATRGCGARCFVTRNVAGYERPPIPALNPQGLLSEPT